MLTVRPWLENTENSSQFNNYYFKLKIGMISFPVFLICNTFLWDSLECHPNFQCFFLCMHKVIKSKNDTVQVVFNFRIYGFSKQN